MLFKNKAYNAVLDEKTISLKDSSTCDFGKWRQNEGQKEFGDTSAFQQMDEPHRRVHDDMKKAMNIIDSGHMIEKSDELMKLFSHTEEHSHQFFELLNQMVAEKK